MSPGEIERAALNPIARLADVCRRRAENPRAIFYLREYALSDGQVEVVALLMANLATELDHVAEEGRQNIIAAMAPDPALRLVKVG